MVMTVPCTQIHVGNIYVVYSQFICVFVVVNF